MKIQEAQPLLKMAFHIFTAGSIGTEGQWLVISGFTDPGISININPESIGSRGNFSSVSFGNGYS